LLHNLALLGGVSNSEGLRGFARIGSPDGLPYLRNVLMQGAAEFGQNRDGFFVGCGCSLRAQIADVVFVYLWTIWVVFSFFKTLYTGRAKWKARTTIT
jgi:hypothetical protein